jgi:peptidylprolyl isomerase
MHSLSDRACLDSEPRQGGYSGPVRPSIEGLLVKHRTSTGVAALALAAALALTGCGGGGSGDSASPSPSPTAAATGAPSPSAEDIAALDAVEVKGEAGSEPELSFDSPFEVSAPTSRIVEEGTGAELTEGLKVTMQYVAYQADGTRLGSTWESKTPESFVLGNPQYDLLNSPLAGQKVGTRMLLANPTQDQQGQPSTVLNLVEITDVKEIPSRAEGEAVTPAEGLPAVTLDDTGKPSVEIPEGYEAPKDVVAQPLIKGDGPKVTQEQTVTAHYTGWKLDGTVFDSSWDRGTPTDFPLNGVIAGWTEGLSGQTVGSQVLLVIPAAKAYGAKADGSHELAGEDLVFVVDILDATG